MDCIYLAQDRESWWALVNGIMEFGVHKIREISGLVKKRFTSEEQPYSMQ